jgi:hypothetical protein
MWQFVVFGTPGLAPWPLKTLALLKGVVGIVCASSFADWVRRT